MLLSKLGPGTRCRYKNVLTCDTISYVTSLSGISILFSRGRVWKNYTPSPTGSGYNFSIPSHGKIKLIYHELMSVVTILSYKENFMFSFKILYDHVTVNSDLFKNSQVIPQTKGLGENKFIYNSTSFNKFGNIYVKINIFLS